MTTPLTKKQKNVLDFIKSFQEKNGFSPTLEETGKKFKLSKPTVHQHLSALDTKGYIKQNKGHARSIELMETKTILEIPLLGTISAGEPIEAIEIPGETISVAKNTLSASGKHYALRVKGDSMIEEGIFDGDTVVIKEQKTADNGQTVVAIIDNNQATLKKIYKEKDRIRLQPMNQAMLPFFRTDVEIRGVVINIIRNLEIKKDEIEILADIIYRFPYTSHARRITSDTKKEIKPFLQWVGGKRGMISQYKKFLPTKFNTFYEPFLGGGAMYFYLKPNKAVLNDNNLELIKTCEGIRDNPEEVIKLLKELKKRHSKELYMKIRVLDREINIFNELNSAEIAARMIYLNQAGFNGVYRVNKKSQFNVPIGSSLNRLICDEGTIKADSKILKEADIKCDDFEKTLQGAKKDDFVYLDPPYHPISEYSNFTRYTKEKFFKEDQERLKTLINKLTKKGVKIMLSNSNCKFINTLYKDYKIEKVESNRSLNCKADKRGKVSEVLIMNY
ncbi:transcriptional repressor LexA [Patescibacteria group bacterium]